MCYEMDARHPVRRCLLSFFWLALLLSGPAGHASTLERILERGTVVVGTSANMPPMSFTDAQGRVTGFDVDLARFIASAMSVRLETRVLPFDQLIPALEKGEVDMVISNLTMTPERNLRVAFAGPYLISGKCVVAKNEALARGGAGTDINKPEITIAVLRGSTSEAFTRELLPSASVVEVADYDSAAVMVREDRADGLLTDYPICQAVLKAYPDAGFVSLSSLLTYEPIGIALPAGDAHFLNFTQNLLERLDGTNAIDQLSDLWFGPSRPGNVD